MRFPGMDRPDREAIGPMNHENKQTTTVCLPYMLLVRTGRFKAEMCRTRQNGGEIEAGFPLVGHKEESGQGMRIDVARTPEAGVIPRISQTVG